MGVNLKDLVPKATIRLEDLSGRSLAVDAYNALYQFLAIIRQPDGTPLMDREGKVTSHLSGLLYRTSNLMEMGIRPIYVFDGAAPALKEAEIGRRAKAKKEALIRYEKALKEGKLEDARKHAQATSRLKDYMTEDSRRLLDLMGIPWIQAPSEGEAQAAHLVKRGDADFCASQDYDSLLFGTPRLVRNVTISGRRKLPGKKLYVEVVPEVVELEEFLRRSGITYEQLIDIGILLGTDFNPDGIKGLGPKKALKLVREHGKLEKALLHVEGAEFPVSPDRIREIFMKPTVTDEYEIIWKEPRIEQIVNFICGERDFSEERVRRTLERMVQGSESLKGKTTLEKWLE